MIFLEMGKNNQVLGYSTERKTEKCVETDQLVPNITAIQKLYYINNKFVVKESKELQEELDQWNYNSYARDRIKEYPTITEQLDDLFHQGAFSKEMTAKIQKVKDEFPKPE
tara:strand:- start:47 stop:379 length:333 start_codon:yes stop_codon:yes gene_type:complete